MKITLTPQQKLQLEQMHDIERDSRVCDRIKAVLLASEGWSQTMISIDDYESINSETIVRFFCKLRESYPLAHKLHIILDGAGYHRSDLVRDAAFVLNIELHYLPPYSPNLNPIERLWKVMNEKSRNNVYFKSKRDFKAAIDQVFTVTLPEIPGSLASRINDNFQVLKPASSS